MALCSGFILTGIASDLDPHSAVRSVGTSVTEKPPRPVICLEQHFKEESIKQTTRDGVFPHSRIICTDLKKKKKRGGAGG